MRRFRIPEALAKPLARARGTGILPVFHGRDAHATRSFAGASPVIRKFILTGLTALAASGLRAAGPASLAVRANRSRIYLGESVQLQVVLEGSNDRSLEPAFPQLQGAGLQFLGSQDNSSRSVRIINGRMTQETFLGRVFIYQLTPKQAGRIAVGNVTLTLDGRTLTARGPVIEVTGVEQRDDLIVTIESSRQTALVDEPFTVTLRILIAFLPAPNEAIEPLLQQRPPHLQADFLNLKEVRGLKQPNLEARLNEMARQAGRAPVFTINNYQSQGFGGSLFDFGNPFEPRPLPFRLPVKRVTHEGKPFWEYGFTLDYTAQLEGDYTFGPVTLKGAIIKGADGRGNAIMDEVFTVGPAVTVRVVPPPETGRPDWFIGSVGRNLRATATLDTALCKVGDPLTLTLEITGDISIGNLRPPVLGLLPGMPDDFRLYSEPFATETLENGKRFKYRIRPLKSGTLEFPALPVAYYDTEQMEYVTVHTQPLPLQAQATTQIAAVSDDPLLEDTQALTAADRQPDGILLEPANNGTARGLQPTRQRLLNAVIWPPAGFLLVLALRGAWRRRHVWAAGRRQARALPHAHRGLRQAHRLAARDPVAAALQGAQAIRAYLGERLGVEAQGITAAELPARFRGMALPAAPLESLQAAFAELEQLPFHPQAATAERVAELLKRATDDLAQLDRALARAPRRPSADQALLLLLAAALAMPGAARAARMPDAFTWERANQAMAGARSPDEFLGAAKIYNDLIRDGARSGPLFYNLGTALLMAGDARNAEAALVRAERHLGATPEIRNNLRLAIAARTGQPDAPLPPSRVFLAWHYHFSFHLRLWLMLAGWALFWCGLTLRLLTPPPAGRLRTVSRRRAFANLLTGWGCALLLIYGGSVAFTALQEQHDNRFWHERVLTTAEALPPTMEAKP